MAPADQHQPLGGTAELSESLSGRQASLQRDHPILYPQQPPFSLHLS